MTALQEAEALVAGINRALGELRANRPNPCQESEVEFRFDVLIGVLIIARNDAKQMEKQWRIDQKRTLCMDQVTDAAIANLIY